MPPFFRSEIKRLSNNDPSLTSLNLSRRGVTGADVRDLAKGLKNNTHLKKLDLNGSYITDVAVATLADALEVNVALKVLGLGGSSISDEGAVALANVLKKNGTLTKLGLQSNYITDVGAIALADAIKKNGVLTVFYLSNNKITDEGAVALADAIKENGALKELGLGHNEITDVGAVALANELNVIGALIHLGLGENNIADEGAVAFANVLKVNSTLAELRLNNNKISDVGAVALADALKVKKVALKELWLHGNNITDKELISKIDELLSKRPTPAIVPTPGTTPSGPTEIMRVVMSTPDSDPCPVPLSYLDACTDEFSEGRKIGEGGFSCVYEGKDRTIRRKFAVKKMRLFVDDANLEEARNTFEREIVTLKQFRHPNIARMYAYYISPDLRDHCLVYELASDGSLHDALRSKRKIHWTTRINIALDVARALEYLHVGQGDQICYHRDVKSANVCLRRNYTALLIDYGISKMIPDGGGGGSGGTMTMTIMDSATGNGAWGTRGYICPSFMRKRGRFVSANDVFSLGVVLAEIFTGLLQNVDEVDMFDRYSPDGDGVRDLERDAVDGDVSGEWGEWDADVRGGFIGLAVECLRQKPEKRPAIGDIVRQLECLASKSRPRSPGERNHITVLSSAPLVYTNWEGKLCPTQKSPNFALERDQLVACIKESKRDITLTFDTATDSRLLAAATRRCGCLHFSGHGHKECLIFEDGKGGVHWIGEEKLYDSVHTQPFKFAFVSACFSQLMGEALIKAGVPHVVCCEHDQELRDDATIKFTHTFYYALAEGYTVKDAFKKGKMAVERRFHDEEASKFMLLPEDGDHDTPLFDAQLLEWNDEKVGAESAMPSMPHTLLRRELEVYSLLQLILNGRLVNLVGDAGIGCSSLALEVGNYIRDRRSTMVDIGAVYYIRSDELDDECDPEMPLKRMYEALVNERRALPLSAEAGSTLTAQLVEALNGMKALIIFDRVESDDSVLLNFVTNMLERSSACRVLLISRAKLHISSVSAEGQAYNLGPLAFEDAAHLFGEACRHIDVNIVAAWNVLFDKIVDTELSQNSHVHEAITGGNPGRIIECAKSMSEEEYLQLLRS